MRTGDVGGADDACWSEAWRPGALGEDPLTEPDVFEGAVVERGSGGKDGLLQPGEDWRLLP